jgi:phthalate 4,5-cis-dihydrodiol dehydrogenase
MRAGKHVAVEKPMAVTLEEADRMVAAAAENRVKLISGHTEAYSLPMRAMRKIALSGAMGQPMAIFNWSYTDWMLRPRTTGELAPSAGSGIVHRQGPHQIDAVRLIGGGKLRSVRGAVGGWLRERPVPGFYTAYLEFDDGLPATIVHNGHGYFMTLEFYPQAEVRWRYKDADHVALRRAIRSAADDGEAGKQLYRIGGRNDPTARAATKEVAPWSPLDLGMFVLSCEGGDIRHSEIGLSVYGNDGRREIDLRPRLAHLTALEEGGVMREGLIELYEAVVNGRPSYHSGEWGRATLEALLAVIRSSQEKREIELERQVAMPDDYDADLTVPEAVPA